MSRWRIDVNRALRLTCFIDPYQENDHRRPPSSREVLLARLGAAATIQTKKETTS